MFVKQSLGGRLISQLLVLVAIVAIALPLILIVQISFQGQGAANYLVVVRDTPFLLFLVNSGIISAATVILVLLMAIAASYTVSVLVPRGSWMVLIALLAGLSVPAIGLVIPVFSLMQQLGLIDTYWAVVIPLTALSLPFGVLVGSNYMKSIPAEVFEAAAIDGAGSFRVFRSVLVPLCRPIVAVIAIFTFLAAWNEYLLPLLFLQDTGMKVVTQVPTYFQSQHLVDNPKVFAANILISLPIVIVYLLLQRTFRHGLTSGAVK